LAWIFIYGNFVGGLGGMEHIDLLFQQFFNLKNFGSLYNFITMPNPIGYLIFPGLIAVTIYYWEAEK
jgi:hypothetical protein